jgi:RNA polymerase sigma factor (sigma-70 family)
MDKTWSTRHTLIERLQTDDNLAWDEFLTCYRPFIHFLLNQMNVSLPDQDDLVQLVLIKLHQSLPTYAKDKGTFRNWLSTVIRNTVNNYFVKESRLQRKNNAFAESLQVFNSYSETTLNGVIEKEWENFLIKTALERLQNVLSKKHLDCFSMAIDGNSIEHISATLDIHKHNVYKIRTRIKPRLLKEIQGLIKELEF